MQPGPSESTSRPRNRIVLADMATPLRTVNPTYGLSSAFQPYCSRSLLAPGARRVGVSLVHSRAGLHGLGEVGHGENSQDCPTCCAIRKRSGIFQAMPGGSNNTDKA